MLGQEEITYKIIGCAMNVHKTIGNGFQEVVYQRCLAIEFRKANLEFVREQEQTLYYQGEEVGSRRADFVVEGNLVVELKALLALEKVHIAQARNYLVAYNFREGLIKLWSN